MIASGLDATDLHVDQVYGGSRQGNAADDPLPALLGVDSGAGFRHLGKRPSVATLKLLALKTSLADDSWPDSLDRETGRFVYFGDRRSPGPLLETPRDGNLILQNLFAEAHGTLVSTHFPPILLFANAGTFRDVRFLGLAVPGAPGMSADEDLIAVWRTDSKQVRFQNYRATFTVLNVPTIPRAWILDAQRGHAVSSPHAPKPWAKWVSGRKHTPLTSPKTTTFRTKQQQQVSPSPLSQYTTLVYERFKNDSYGFERCAMEIARLYMPSIERWEITRPWRDGGRDAVGEYRIGIGPASIDVEFALEAKCYAPERGVGVKPLSRLLSRLRHRQFGILVTTSYLSDQAYKELVSDQHPVIVISARDIAEILKLKFGALASVKTWLQQI